MMKGRMVTMKMPVRISTRCTNMVGPDGTLERWSAQATIYGRPIADVYESDGCGTEAAAVRLLQARIREDSARARRVG